MGPDHAAQAPSRPRLLSPRRPLQAAVNDRYNLPAWTAADHAQHKRADRLAAANEAYHVVGWPLTAMREQLGIELAPLDDDPLDLPPDQRPWEPWPPKLAQVSFLRELQALATDQTSAAAGAWPADGR